MDMTTNCPSFGPTMLPRKTQPSTNVLRHCAMVERLHRLIERRGSLLEGFWERMATICRKNL